MGDNHSTSGSATSPSQRKDAMRIWQEMKQNGFLSPPSPPAPVSMPSKRCKKRQNDMSIRKLELGKPKIAAPATVLVKELSSGISSPIPTLPTPKQCSEKHTSCMSKRQMEIAEVEQENRFAKVAAPSGLLNGLTPGIINRIRNSEQVFSVIEALVRRDKMRNVNIQSKQEAHVVEGCKDNVMNDCPNSLSGRSDQLRICSMASNRLLLVKSEYKEEAGNLGAAVMRVENEDVKVEVNSLQSLSTLSDNASSSMLNEGSTNTSDSTTSEEALNCSRIRVQDIIQTEIPFLIVKEFSCKQENEQLSAAGCPIATTMDMHQARWAALFDQMNKALNEEADHMELWLNQVIEMQTHSSDGFCCLNWYPRRLLPQPGVSDCDTRKL